MAQDDRGLVLRGLFLLALIGCLVTFVLTLMFWRTDPPASAPETAPEIPIAVLMASDVTSFPGGIAWAALSELGETLPSAPGWEIRYNAAASLARRGSPNVPWPLVREMLDEKQQAHNRRVRLPEGRDTNDEDAARSNMVSALRALKIWHEKQAGRAKPVPSPELLAVYAAVDKLAESPTVELKKQAEETRASFFRATR